MQDLFSSWDDLVYGYSGHFLVVSSTLLLTVIISLYFAFLLKDDSELEDEGLGADELRLEDDPQIQEQMWSRLQCEIDDDEAYEEDDEPLSESETELASGDPKEPIYNYNHLVGTFRNKQYKTSVEKNLSPDQIEEEKRIEREQLAAIFELLRKQEAELNLGSISDQELNQQVKLYR